MYLGLVGSGRINAYKAVSLAQSYHDSDILISSDVVWASNSYQGGSIIVDSLATLTINSTINFAPSARIIVRPGGKIIVDGGTLTSACTGEMWQGIEVVGDRTQHQNAAHQGTVIFRNGATIENAHCAIKTGLDGNEWLTSGGIVQCTGSTFKNNRRAVEFISYADTLASGNIGDNKSWFKDCTFTLDSTNLFLSQGMQFLNHVTLWDVKGVSFEGCTFENSTAGNTTDRKHGIYALGAGFKVNTLCNTLDGCNCHGAADTNIFTGFSTAVEVGNDGCPYSVTIDEAKFENNGTGVSIQACDYATVTRCTFDLSTNPVNTRNTLGLRLDNSTGVSHTPQSQADAFSVGASHTPPISQPEMDNYADFRALAASLRPSANNPAVNWPAATPAQVAELQRIAEANTGRSSVMAKGVLCFFFDICYGEEIDGTLRAGTYSGKGGKTAQWTYWPEHTNVGIPCYSQPFSLLEDTLIGTLSYNKSDFAIRTASGQNANILILDDSTGMYYYDTIFQIPRMLYDYSAEEGGQFTVYPIMGDTNHQILVTVDSIGYETLDNQILKSFYIHTYSFSSQEPDYIWSFDVLNMEFKAKYIEHIGSTCFLLPQKVSPIHYSDVFYRSLCSFDCESVHYQPIDSIDCNEPYDFIIYDVPQHEQPLVQLHPNPAANSITISGGTAITRVAAYNAQGQLMTVVPVTHQVTYSMNVTNWPKGLYFIHVETESGTATLKMVKL